jgi:hypothetical protein
MLGIERVLPNDVRSIAREKRRQHREKIANAATRAAVRAKAVTERERTRVLHCGDFVVAGVRFSERREACETLEAGDQVILGWVGFITNPSV